MILSYRDLNVWKESMDLVTMIYKITDKFPRHELFLLTAQLRRAAVSVPSNIAEGSGRKGTKELVNFLHIARGSLAEIATQLEIAHRLGYTENSAIAELKSKCEAIAKMINSLIASLNRRRNSNVKQYES